MENNKESFTCVYFSDAKKLNLSGNELLIYSLIKGYTKSDGMLRGGCLYISRTLNINSTTVHRTINKLLSKGLIEKVPTGGRTQYAYKVTDNLMQNAIGNENNNLLQNATGNLVQNATDLMQNARPPSAKRNTTYCKMQDSNIDSNLTGNIKEKKESNINIYRDFFTRGRT